MVAQKATQILGDKLNTVVSIKKIDISFFKFVSLEQVYIEDLNEDTLFFINKVSTEIDFWKFKHDSLKLNLGLIQIDQISYNLTQNKDDSITNLTQLFAPLFTNDTSGNNVTIEISSSQISISEGTFSWNNKNKEPILPFGVDWDHIGLTHVNGDISNFEMINDTFHAQINNISGKDQSGFTLNNFSGEAIFSPTLTQINQLNILTPFSNIQTNVTFEYDAISSYAEFVDQVFMSYQLDTSIINLRDIAYFAPTLEGLDYELTVFGKETGPVSDMKFRDIYVAYGEATVLYGRVFITGLPHIETTSFVCNFKQLSTIHSDLATIKSFPFTEGKTLEIPKFLKNSGHLEYIGNFTGFYNNFVSYGTFESGNGRLSTDIKLAQKESGNIEYDGKIKTVNFNLAQLTNQPELFDKASIDIDVKGENLSFDEMDLEVDGTASAFDFKGYTYKNVKVDATISKKIILGTLDIIDTNLNLAFNGKIDLSKEIPQYEFTSDINHLRPKQLHLMERDSSASLTTQVAFNFRGNSLDNVLGSASLSNFEFLEFEKEVKIKNIDFTAYTFGKDKTMSLKSENIDLQINGEFSFEEIVPSLNFVMYNWIPSAFDGKPEKPKSLERFTMNLDATRFSGFSSIFVPGITFKKDLKIDLSYDSEKQEIELASSSTYLNIVGQDFKDFNIKALLTTDTFLLHSETKKVLFTDSNFVENVVIDATANQDLINTHINWNNDNTTADDAGDLNFDIQFIDPNNFKIFTNSSWINLNDTMWTISDSSEIAKNYKEFIFNDVVLSQKNQSIRVSGFISEDPKKQLQIKLDSIDLKHLNPLLQKYNMNTSGKIDGTAVLFDFYNEFKLHANTRFAHLNFNNQEIGNGQLNSKWNSETERFDIDVSFTDKDLEKLSLQGAYYPKYGKENLDLQMNMEQFPIKIIEPFTKEILDGVTGTISGNARITGELKHPNFDGNFTLHDLQTRVIYLNETLHADNQKIFIRPNLIGADAIIITDSDNKQAAVNFSLFHNNFEQINYDAFISSINIFRAFNTTKEDNQYFYGKVYLNPGSSLGIESDYEGNISLNATIFSGPNTFVTIPFFDDDEIAERDYIYFKEPDSVAVEIAQEDLMQEETVGLNLNMDLNLNKEAEIQLIFDEFTNDKIQATGEGNITLKINENQDFNIYGSYTINDGFYLFTFSKVINKKFAIKDGGKLTWNGDPYAGTANIDASYKVRTSIAELGITTTADSTTANKRVPVEVILHMTGNYMNPELAFSFKLPVQNVEVETLLNTLDASEKNKQVFALLILNKFLPISGDPTTGSSSALATNSSEVLSNQLSNWLSKISNDFDIGVRYSPGQQTTDPDNISSTADEIELALSTQLFDDRVLIETNFGITGDVSGTNTSNSSSNFVGEFTVSYKVNQKGNIVGKVFNRSNELNPVYQNTAPYTQGIGIAYSEPFKNGRNLSCIMANNFTKQENKRDCEQEYYQQQIAEKEKNLEQITKKVARSRKKQKERNRKNAIRLQKTKIKEEEN